MKKDFIITFITEFFVLVSAILVYKLVASFLGKEAFSEYALSRRTVSLIQPALLMGMGVGIPRYIAYSLANSNQKKSDAYFIGGFSVCVLSSLIFGFILLLFRKSFSYLFFGNANYAHLLFPISLMLFGLILNAVCYSYFRGKLLMFWANLLQFINMGLVPVLALFLVKTLSLVLIVTGLAWICVSSFFLFSIISNLHWEKRILIPQSKELLAYGLQRVPGDFGLAGLLSLPATFTAHISGVKEAGYVAFGISLLSIVGTAFAPIGLIFLPKASQLIAAKNLTLLKYYITRILRITIVLTVIGILFFELFAKRIIDLYLGKSFSDLVLTTKIIIIGSLAYAIYVSIRSIIDAYHVKAINTINIFLSLSLFLVLSGMIVLMVKQYLYLAISFIIALFMLGLLTLFEIKKILRRMDDASLQ